MTGRSQEQTLSPTVNTSRVRGTLVATGCLTGAMVLGWVLRVDQRVAGIMLALTSLAAAALVLQMSEARGDTWRWLSRAVGVLLVLNALIFALVTSANWPLQAGRAAREAGDRGTARVQYERALKRMDAPGVLVLSGRYKLTAYGPVFMGRVTLLISLAAIAKEEGRTADVLPLLRKAQAASTSDPEKAGLDQLDALIKTLERQESEAQD